MPVEAIMGADDMYDVVKFRVGISGKKVTALTLAAVAPAAGADVYLLPYSTQKDRSFTAGKVKEADKISGNYSYYTLDMRLKDKMVSCPLMTVDGPPDKTRLPSAMPLMPISPCRRISPHCLMEICH